MHADFMLHKSFLFFNLPFSKWCAWNMPYYRKMLFIIWLCGKVPMVVNASKANKTNYHISLLHNQLTFYIVMFKKCLYLKCVFYFTIICGLGCGSMGGWGRGSLFIIATDGNLQKILYAHFKYFSIWHFW